MATLNRYCKAYPIGSLSRFAGWPQNIPAENGKNNEEQRDFLYVQDTLIVTRDIFADEQIVFSNITDEWKTFCREELKFSVPSELSESSPSETVSG